MGGGEVNPCRTRFPAGTDAAISSLWKEMILLPIWEIAASAVRHGVSLTLALQTPRNDVKILNNLVDTVLDVTAPYNGAQFHCGRHALRLAGDTLLFSLYELF